MEYTFTLKYRLAEQDCDHADIVERLGTAGCDDALIGVGQSGRLALEFTREADSAEAAMVSALADIKGAVASARLIEAAPDFVGLTGAIGAGGCGRDDADQSGQGSSSTHSTRAA